MTSLAVRHRTAFSLLEVIIATAILAGSAMLLFSLIAMGSKWGNRAEERTLVMSQAQSLLDEFLASQPGENQQEERTGTLPGVPTRSYRIETVPFVGSTSVSNPSSANTGPLPPILLRVTVSVFEANAPTTRNENEPIVELSRLIRSTQRQGADPAPSDPVPSGI